MRLLHQLALGILLVSGFDAGAGVLFFVSPTPAPNVPVVANQATNFGALTLASAGGYQVVVTGFPATGCSISGASNPSGYWQISNDAACTITPTSGGVGHIANIVLAVTATNAAGSSAAGNVTVTALASTYTIATTTQLNSVLAISVATVSGKTILARTGTYSAVSISGKVFTSRVTISSDDTSSMAHFDAANGKTFDIVNTDNLTLDHLEISNSGSHTADFVVKVRGPSVSDAFILQNCYIHGVYHDPNGNYSVAGSYVDPTGIGTDGNVPNDLTIQDNTITDLWAAIDVGPTGFFHIYRNTIARAYFDMVQIGQHTGSIAVEIEDNTISQPIGKSTDADAPHVDMLQGVLGTVEDWPGLIISGNVIFRGDARGDNFHGIFWGEGGGTHYVLNPSVHNNVILTEETPHGISFEAISGGDIYSNTSVKQLPSGATSVTAIKIATSGSTPRSAGTINIHDNVSEVLSTGGSATIVNTNNAFLGLNGVTTPYTTAFDGPTFDPQTSATALTKYAPKNGGPLDVSPCIGAIACPP